MQTRQDYTLRISVLSFMGEVRDYKKMQKFEAMQKQKQFFFTDNRPFFQASRTRFERNNFETDSSSLKMSNASMKKQAA